MYSYTKNNDKNRKKTAKGIKKKNSLTRITKANYYKTNKSIIT